LRIIYLQHFYTTLNMAGGTRCYELARRLAAAGHEVHVVTSRAGSGEMGRGRWLQRQEGGVHIHARPMHYADHVRLGRRLLSLSLFNWLTLMRTRRIAADIVLASSPPLSIVLAAVGIARTQGIPLLLEVRSPWPELPVEIGAWRSPLLIAGAKLVESVSYRSAAHIVTLSGGMKESIMQRGVSPQKITVIPSGYDPAQFEGHAAGRPFARRFIPDLSDEQPLIVYTGTFDLLHSVGYILDLAAATHRLCPDARFLLVGSGTQLARLTRQARRSGALRSYLWIEKPIPKRDIPRLLSAATLTLSTVMPRRALWNNAASKFPETLAAGKPIAINYQGWQAELLEKTGAGIVLPHQDAQQAAKLLVAFMSDPDRLRKAAAAARAVARRHFNYDDLALDLEAALARTLHSPYRGTNPPDRETITNAANKRSPYGSKTNLRRK
jgi:glycosyltransferase involved in cell wall biosynthesis